MSVTTNTLDKQACLHLESESIKPDVRVAYEEGLVLGVDEFVQEQRYHLEKDYLHNRSLHGYGTVYGLAVNIAKSQSEAEPDKKLPKQTTVTFEEGETVWLKVGPGVGVDQRGRTFVVPQTYCINFTTWWQQLINDNNKTQPKITTEEGKQHASIYIRARYDETCGDEVTLAGQACNNGATTSANSRIYDSVYLEPSIEKPVMSAWNLAQRFAWFRSKIRYIPAIDQDTDLLTSIESYVRGWLADDDYQKEFDIRIKEWEDPAKPGYIPLPDNNETTKAIEKLQRTYVTDAAPSGHPVNPYAQPATPSGNDILLAQIDLTGTDTEGKFLTIDTVSLVEDERPYLLGTQTFQELANIGKYDKNRRRIFASLHVEDPTSLWVWIHHSSPLNIPSQALENMQIILKRNGNQVAKGDVLTVSAGYFFHITLIPNDQFISHGELIELSFHLDKLKDENGDPLDLTLFTDYVGLNDDGNIITVYTVAENLPLIQSLTTIKSRLNSTNTVVLDVGFNFGTRISLPAGSYQIFKAGGQSPLPGVSAPVDTIGQMLPITIPGIKDGDLLTIRFDAHQVMDSNKPLWELMRRDNVTFVGYDGTQFIDVPYLVNTPIQFTEQEIKGFADNRDSVNIPPYVKEQLDILRTLPFATITPSLFEYDKEHHYTQLQFEIWLHTALAVTNYSEVLVLNPTNLEIYAERAGTTVKVNFDAVTTMPSYNNVFQVTATIPDTYTPDDLDFTHLRFVFLTDKIISNPGKTPLQTFIDNNHIKFEGNYISSSEGNNAIVVYLYVSRELKPNPPPSRPKIIEKLAVAAPKAEAAPTPKARTTRRAGGKT